MENPKVSITISERVLVDGHLLDVKDSFETIPVGELVRVHGHLLEVVASESCKGCYYDTPCRCLSDKIALCSSTARIDGISVIFKEVQQ